MKLTTKRNRWYFWRELFSYMIPMILIVGTVDVFRNFMICPLHPEWSAPCSVNWALAVIYGIFLVIVIILAIISARMLRKIKKRIENEFLEVSNHSENVPDKEIEKIEKKSENFDTKKPKKIIVKSDKKESTKKVIKKEIKTVAKITKESATKK